MIRSTAACALATACSLASALLMRPAHAETLALACSDGNAGQGSGMTITYDGGATGTVKVVASFGEMVLPATRQETEIEIDGQTVAQTGIRAFGEARVSMPDKAALDACIAEKRAPDETDDILGLMACQNTVELAEADIKADLELVVHGDGGDPFVYLKRTFLEKSGDYLSGNGETGGFISIESIPPPSCTPAKSGAMAGDGAGCTDRAIGETLAGIPDTDPKYIEIWAKGMQDGSCRGYSAGQDVTVDESADGLACVRAADDETCFWVKAGMAPQ